MSRKKGAAGGAECRRFAAAISCLREIHGKLVEENRILMEDPRRPVPDDSVSREELEAKLLRLEMDNRALAARLEATSGPDNSAQQEDLLANLYVAGYHLHRAVDLQAVLNSVKEILLNLVGAEKFAIYLLDADGTTLTQVADDHSRPPASRRIPLSEGIMGVVAKTGISYFDGERQQGDFHNPVACIPLKVEEQLLGVIQIHRLFIQKKTLNPQDHEIFTLLAETAGTALLSALLRRRYLHADESRSVPWGELVQGMKLTSDAPEDTAREPLPDQSDQEGGRT